MKVEISNNSLLGQLSKEIEELNPAVATKKGKTPKIVCSIDGELMRFKNESALKKFMWNQRPETVIRYDLVGTVEVPFELQIKETK